MNPPEIVDLMTQIMRLLAGKESGIQGAVLADLLAIWLAGHTIIGDPEATARLRDEILQLHIATVRELIPENARLMGTIP